MSAEHGSRGVEGGLAAMRAMGDYEAGAVRCASCPTVLRPRSADPERIAKFAHAHGWTPLPGGQWACRRDHVPTSRTPTETR